MSQSSENRLIIPARYALCLLTVSGVLLSSCAGSGAGSVVQTTRVEYYPSCHEPVSYLRSTDNAMCNSAITDIITSGLPDGLAGGLASDGNRDHSTALTAASGALAGGTVDYYMEKQKQISDDRACIGSYITYVNRSTVEINYSTAHVKSVQNYYQSQFKALLDDRKDRSINGAKGCGRLAEIISGLQEINVLLVAANGRADENVSNYTQAYEKDLQQVGASRIEATKVAEVEDRASATKGNSKLRTDSSPKMPKEAVATEQTICRAQDA